MLKMETNPILYLTISEGFAKGLLYPYSNINRYGNSYSKKSFPIISHFI
jgi:hypothetical protein